LHIYPNLQLLLAQQKPCLMVLNFTAFLSYFITPNTNLFPNQTNFQNCSDNEPKNLGYVPLLVEAAIGSFSWIQSSSSSTSRKNCCRRSASFSFSRRATIGSWN